MTSIKYDSIFSYFLGNIHDLEFANLSSDDAYELMTEYLKKSLADPYVNHVFASYSLDDEVQIVTFIMTYPTTDQADCDFVTAMLAKAMVVNWLKPLVTSKLNIAQFFGNSESKFYSQSNHLSELRNLYNETKLELKKMIRDYGYINNSYLGGT